MPQQLGPLRPNMPNHPGGANSVPGSMGGMQQQQQQHQQQQQQQQQQQPQQLQSQLSPGQSAQVRTPCNRTAVHNTVPAGIVLPAKPFFQMPARLVSNIFIINTNYLTKTIYLALPMFSPS
jgi:hypothetical protein